MKSKLSSLLFSAMLAATTLLAVQARAEDNAGGPPPAGENHKGPKPGDRLKQMAEKLGLSDEQVTKIKAIFEAEAQEIKALRKDGGEPSPEKRDQMKAVREKYRAQVDAVLTPEQREKAAAMRAKHGDGQKGPKGGKDGEGKKGKGPKGENPPPHPAE